MRNNDKTQLHRQWDGRENYKPIGQPSKWVYNALAYNTEDKWLYAVSQIADAKGGANAYHYCYPMGHLLQIDPSNGNVYNLGPIVGPNGGKDF